MNKRHYEHTLPNIRGSLSNTYGRRTGGEKANEKEYLYIVYHLNPSFEGVKIIIFLSVYPLEQVL